jgi:hypothetical protein
MAVFPRAFVRLLAPVSVAVALSGCAAWDDFSWRKMNFEVFRTPDNPFEVAAKSNDGAERVRALHVLHEPSAHGGSQKDQDAYVLLLTHTAAKDPLPMCRQAAIHTLGGYRDVRAVEGLKEAYYQATTFDGGTASQLRQQALAALGRTPGDGAVDLLIRVLREPPAEGPDVDRDARMQERIAAARALAHHDGPKVRAALAEVMAKEEDVALHRGAHESLVALTGQTGFPENAKVWDEYLRSPAGRDMQPQRPGLGESMMRLVGWK